MANKPLDYENYTLLIIDDDSTNLDMLISYLEEYGFRLIVALNGEIGLKKAQIEQPNLILLDVMMPGIDGFETCRRLKADEKTKEIPVIFMTLLDSNPNKIKGFDVGGVDYVTKPIYHKEVLARITTHLELRDLTVKLNSKVEELTQTRYLMMQQIEELTETRHQLVQSEKMASLGRLVAGFAHEINTPIGVAVGAASTLHENVGTIDQLLEQEEVDEEELVGKLNNIKEAANLTLSNLKRASLLVNRFKNTAINQSEESLRQFQVKSAIFDVINSLHRHFENTVISIQVDCSKELSIHSLCGALEQILTHLMINSLVHGFEAGKKSGSINIVVRLNGDNLHFEYSDTGKGIASEHIENIFEPFFTTDRTHGASGLGLYMCYNLVTTQLRGTITCESSPGNGVRFEINYPIKEHNETS